MIRLIQFIADCLGWFAIATVAFWAGVIMVTLHIRNFTDCAEFVLAVAQCIKGII